MRKLSVMLGITCLVLLATGCGEDFAHSVRQFFGTANDSGPAPHANTAPTVTLTASPAGGAVPLDVTLTAVGSDSDGTIAGYEFDFGEGAGFGASAAAATASHSYASAGTFTARVRVTDNGGATATAQATIVATVAGPTATITGQTQGIDSHVGEPIHYGNVEGAAVYLLPAAAVPALPNRDTPFPVDAVVDPGHTPTAAAVAYAYTDAGGMFSITGVPYGDYVLFRLWQVSAVGQPLAFVHDHEAITADSATLTVPLAQLDPTDTGGGGSGGSGVLPAFAGRVFMPGGTIPAFGVAVFVTSTPSNPTDGHTQPAISYPANSGTGVTDPQGYYSAPSVGPSALSGSQSYYVTAVLDEFGTNRRWRATTTTAVLAAVPGNPAIAVTQDLILVQVAP